MTHDVEQLDEDIARLDGQCFDPSHDEHISVLMDRLRQWDRWHRVHGDCERTIRELRNEVSQLQSRVGVLISGNTRLADRLEDLTGKRPT